MKPVRTKKPDRFDEWTLNGKTDFMICEFRRIILFMTIFTFATIQVFNRENNHFAI
jgi:hypothetical protein